MVHRRQPDLGIALIAALLVVIMAERASAQMAGSIFDPRLNAYGSAAKGRSPVQETGVLKDLDSLCGPQFTNRFWSIDLNGVVRQWAISGGVALGGDTVLNTTSESLAYCAVNGVNTFYIGEIDSIYYHLGGTWVGVPVGGGALVINLGGAGGYLYYLSDGNSVLNRFDGITASPIALAAPQFATADVAVAWDGSAYLLQGPSIYSATSVEVFDPAGTTLASYPITFDPYSAYGSFMLGDTMYVGLGPGNDTTPDVIVPITFAGGVATFGTPVPFPRTNGVNFADLASCNPGAPVQAVPSAPTPKDLLLSYPVPADAVLHVRLPADLLNGIRTVELFDPTGRAAVIAWQYADGGVIEITGIEHLPDGDYRLRLITTTGESRSAGVIIRHAD